MISATLTQNRVLIQIDDFCLNLPVHLQELSANNTKFNGSRDCDRQSWTECLQLPTLGMIYTKWQSSLRRLMGNYSKRAVYQRP